MIDQTALILARAQFAFTITFHFIFPAFSIGLASYLAVLEGLWLAKGDAKYLDLYKYWLRVFAVVFAMGVVSGVVMSYQFGTNWPNFAAKGGAILGPLMAYEVMTAFFLEAGFLGVMLFGMKKVGKGLHFGATCMVALGTAISAFWILSANSWMHTPTGYIAGPDGSLLPGPSWWAIVFNPSFPYRLTHTVIAAYLTTALAVGGVGAWHLLKGHATPQVKTMFSMAMWMAALVAPIQILAGDQQGLNTLEHQPAKVMAMEGHFQSHPDGAPLILFGWPDQAAQTVRWSVEIPKASSLILKHDPNAALAGLDTVPRADQPPVAIVFWAFRIMVALGFAMFALGLWSLLARARGGLFTWRWMHRLALVMGPSGFVAVTAGWIVTEVGRQPWVVYGLLRTADAAGKVAAPAIATSLAAFAAVYCTVFGFGIWYVLRLMAEPPHPHEPDLAEHPAGQGPIRSSGTAPGPAQGDGHGETP